MEKVSAIRSNLTGFEYVESALVTAIRKGDWVLLDNISAAPPDVVERLMSLTEAVPTLRLYESPECPFLSKDSGNMDSNFCLFATVNSSRQLQGRLSNAFYNRVLRIWVPEVDEEAMTLSAVSSDLRETELYHLVLGLLGDIPGAYVFAKVIALVHCRLKRLVLSRRLVTVGGCNFTLRTALRAARELSRLFRKSNKFSHLSEILEKCYVKCCVGIDQAKALDEIMTVLKETSSLPSLEFTRRNVSSTSQDVDDFEEETLPLKEGAKLCLVNSILAFLAILNFQVKRADSREVTKASSFCQDLMLQLSRTFRSERELLAKVESVKEAFALAELDSTQEKLVDASRKMDNFITAIKMFSPRVADLHTANDVEKYADQTASELFSFGSKLKAFLCRSSFICFQQRLQYVSGVLFQFQFLRRGVSAETWLAEYTIGQKSNMSPEAARIDRALSEFQDGLLLLAQQATVFHGLSFYANTVASLNFELEALINKCALESDKSILLSVIHQMLQQQVVSLHERKWLLQFIAEKAVLPPELLVKVDVFLSATHILFQAEEKSPFRLRQSDLFFFEDERAEKLHDVSLYYNAISALTSLNVAMEQFYQSIFPSLRRIDMMIRSRNNDSLAEAKLKDEKETLREELVSLKKKLFSGSSGESIERFEHFYEESVTSVHSQVFKALANAVRKQKFVQLNVTFLPQVRNLIRQLSPEELDLPLGILWRAAFFGEKSIFTSSEGMWEPYLVLNEIDAEDSLNQPGFHQKIFFVCEGGVLGNQPFSICVVVLNESKKKAWCIRAVEADNCDDHYQEVERISGTAVPFYSLNGKKEMSSTQSPLKLSLSVQVQKLIKSAFPQSIKIQQVLAFFEGDKMTKSSADCEILLVISALERVLSGSPMKVLKLREKVFTVFSGVLQSTAERLKRYCKPNDRQICLKETVEAIKRVSILHEKIEYVSGWEVEHERESRILTEMLKRFKDSYERSQDLAVPRSVKQRHQLLSRISRTINKRLSEIRFSDEDELPWDVKVLTKLEKKILDFSDNLEMKRFSAAEKVVRTISEMLHRTVKIVCDVANDLPLCCVGDSDTQVSFENCYRHPESGARLDKLLASLCKLSDACKTFYCNFRVERDMVAINMDQLLSDAENLKLGWSAFQEVLPSFYNAGDFSSIEIAINDCRSDFINAQRVTLDAVERQQEALRFRFSETVQQLSHLRSEAFQLLSPSRRFLVRLEREIDDAKKQRLERSPEFADIVSVLESKYTALREELSSLTKRESALSGAEMAFESCVEQACLDISGTSKEQVNTQAHHKNSDLENELLKCKAVASFETITVMTELLKVACKYAIEDSQLCCVLKKVQHMRISFSHSERSSQSFSVTSEDRIALEKLIAVTGVGEREKVYSHLVDELSERELDLQTLNWLLKRLLAIYFAGRNRIIHSKHWKHFCSFSTISGLYESSINLIGEGERIIANAAELFRQNRKRHQALTTFNQLLARYDMPSIKPHFLEVSDLYSTLFPSCTGFLFCLSIAEESLADFENKSQEDLPSFAKEAEASVASSGIGKLLENKGPKEETFFSIFSRFIRELSSELKSVYSSSAFKAATLRTYLTRQSFPEYRICLAVFGLIVCNWLCTFISSGLSCESFQSLIRSLASSGKSKNPTFLPKDAEKKVKNILSKVFVGSNVCKTVDEVLRELCLYFQVPALGDDESPWQPLVPVSNKQMLGLKHLFKSLLLFAGGGSRAATNELPEIWAKSLVTKCSKASESLSDLIETLKDNFSKAAEKETVLAPVKLLLVCWTSLGGALSDICQKASVSLRRNLEHECFKTLQKGNRLQEVSHLLLAECKKSTKNYKDFKANVSKLLQLSQELGSYAEEVSFWTTASLSLRRASRVSTKIAALTFLFLERTDKGNSFLKAVEKMIFQHDSAVTEQCSRLSISSQLEAATAEMTCLVSQLKYPGEFFMFCFSGNPYGLLEKESRVCEKLNFWAVLGKLCTNLASQYGRICPHVPQKKQSILENAVKDLRRLQLQRISENLSVTASCSERLLSSSKALSRFLASEKSPEAAEKVLLTSRFIAQKVVCESVSLVQKSLRSAFCRPAPVGVRAQNMELWHTLQLNLLSEDTLSDLAASLGNEDESVFVTLRLLSSFIYEGTLTVGDTIKRMLADLPLFRLDVHFLEGVVRKFDSCSRMCVSFLKRNLLSEMQNKGQEVSFDDASALIRIFSRGPNTFFESGLAAYYNQCQRSLFIPSFPEKYASYRSTFRNVRKIAIEAVNRWNFGINDEVERQRNVCENENRSWLRKMWQMFASEESLYKKNFAEYTKAKKERCKSRKAIEANLHRASHCLASLVQLDLSDKSLQKSFFAVAQEYNSFLITANCRLADLFCIKEDEFSWEFSKLSLTPLSSDYDFKEQSHFEFCVDFDGKEKKHFPVSVGCKRKIDCEPFSLSKGAVKKLTLVVDCNTYKVDQSVLEAMCVALVAKEVTVPFRVPQSNKTVTMTLKCYSKFRLCLGEKFQPLKYEAETLQKCFKESVDAAKSVLGKHEWKPVPPEPRPPKKEQPKFKAKTTFDVEKERLKLQSREVERVALQFFARVEQLFETWVDCLEDSSLPPLNDVSYSTFKKCKDSLRNMSFDDFLRTIEEGNKVISTLDISAPLFVKGRWPLDAEKARKHMIEATSFVQCFFLYSFQRRRSQQLSLMLLCCLTAVSKSDLEECYDMMRSVSAAVKESAKYSGLNQRLLQDLHDGFSKQNRSLLELSQNVCNAKQKNAWMTQTFCPPNEDFTSLSFEDKKALLYGIVPSLHLCDTKECVLVPSLKNFVIKMRCSTASSESMLVRFSIFNNSIAVSAKFQFESTDDADDGFNSFEMIPSSGTLNPLSKVDIAVAFSEDARARSFGQRPLLRSYCLLIYADNKDYRTREKRVEILVEGILEEVHKCIFVSPTTFDFGVIDIARKSFDLTELVTIENTSSSVIPFRVVPVDCSTNSPSIRCSVGGGEIAKPAEELEIEIPSGSSLELHFVLKVRRNQKPERFCKQFALRFSSGRDISLCAQGRFVKPDIVAYDNSNSRRLEDGETLRVSKFGAKFLTFYNSFSAPCIFSLELRREHGSSSDFYLQPKDSQFLVLPKTSQRVSLACSKRDRLYPSVLTVKDYRRANRYRCFVKAGHLLAETDSVVYCNLSSCFANSKAIFDATLPEVQLNLKLDGCYFTEEEEVEVRGAAPELHDCPIVILQPSQERSVALRWTAGSLLRKSGSVICRRKRTGEDTCISFRINFRKQIASASVLFSGFTKQVCVARNAEDQTFQTLFIVETGCGFEVTADVTFTSFGVKSRQLYTNSGAKLGNYVLYVDNFKELKLGCSLQPNADWYGLSMQISFRDQFVSFNEKAFGLWRRLYLVGRSSNMMQQRLSQEMCHQSCNEKEVRSSLAEAVDEKSFCALLRHVTFALCFMPTC